MMTAGPPPLGSLKALIQHGATSVKSAAALLCAYACTEHNWLVQGSSEEEVSDSLEPAFSLFFYRQKKQH